MKKKILLPGWNSCSPKKQELIKIWVESVLQAQAASKALIELCNSEDFAKESAVTLSQPMRHEGDNKDNFEIIEFDDNSEEVIRPVEIPDNFPQLFLKVVCLIGCESKSDSDAKKKCEENCHQKYS